MTNLEVPAIGDALTAPDWPGGPESYIRVGVVTKVEATPDGHIVTLQHPERPEIMWTEWLNGRMVITRAPYAVRVAQYLVEHFNYAMEDATDTVARFSGHVESAGNEGRHPGATAWEILGLANNWTE